MRAPSHHRCLFVLNIRLLSPLPVWAETPSEVQQRLEQYRQIDAEAAQSKARQEQEVELVVKQPI